MFEFQRKNVRILISSLMEKSKNMKEIKQIQSQIITSPFLFTTDQSFFISRLLFFCTVSLYGCLGYAAKIFHSIINPTVFDYTAIIRAYVSTIQYQGLYYQPPLMLYKQMLTQGIKANNITFTFLIKECVKQGCFYTGGSIHGHVLKMGYDVDIFLQNSLIVFYFESGRSFDARRVFDEMLDRDVVSWNSVIMGCLRNCQLDTALDLFRIMEKKNVITWNSIIVGFFQGGKAKEALELFQEMMVLDDEKVKPDKLTIATVISACASVGAIDYGTWVHSYLKNSSLECDTVMGTALLDMYGKCGYIEKAIQVFDEMPKKDILSWTAMISAFARHGMGKEAFELFSKMERVGIYPNSVTFTALLSACAHSGLVQHSLSCFDSMTRVYSIKPQVQHYAIMIDTLSRAGLLIESENLIRTMPIEPDVYVWGALLGGCQMHGNVELGEKVGKYLISLEPLNHAFYFDLCDVYAKGGNFSELKKLRALMDDKGIKKLIHGCSMIEIDGFVHEFSMKSSSESFLKNIVCSLTRLSCEIMIDNYNTYMID